MTINSETGNLLRHKDLADYGFARVRDQAFDAVHQLWRKRQSEGMKQKDIAVILGRDEGWVSRNLRGPGNWTLRTFGELVSALRGEAEINVFPLEESSSQPSNFDAYDGYGQESTASGLRKFTFTVKGPNTNDHPSGVMSQFKFIKSNA